MRAASNRLLSSRGGPSNGGSLAGWGFSPEFVYTKNELLVNNYQIDNFIYHKIFYNIFFNHQHQRRFFLMRGKFSFQTDQEKDAIIQKMQQNFEVTKIYKECKKEGPHRKFYIDFN
jgi:hypothetical protein